MKFRELRGKGFGGAGFQALQAGNAAMIQWRLRKPHSQEWLCYSMAASDWFVFSDTGVNYSGPK
jgi:hypothetical protein